MQIINFLFKSQFGWTIIAFLSIFVLVYFDTPKWTFLIPLIWIFYVFVIGMIGAFNNMFGKNKQK